MPSKVRISEAASNLVNKGRISERMGERLASEEREIEVPDLERGFEHPVFSCFLIDSSWSMDRYREDVIAGHLDLIEPLRQSRKCKKQALFVVQYLFSDTVKLLHPFTKLESKGNDSVPNLNRRNYKPDGLTALYKTLFYLLQDMAANISNALDQNILSTFTIGVITDGEDNQGGVDPQEIAETIQELTTGKYLRSSVVLGLTNKDFTADKLEELKARLGFDEAVSLSQNPKEVRRAFALASKAALSVQ